MRIEKSFAIDAPQDEVWQFVSSPERVGMCFPGSQRVSALGEDRYQAVIKVKIGPIKTVFNTNFEATEERPDGAVTTEQHRLFGMQKAIAAAIGVSIVLLLVYFLTH